MINLKEVEIFKYMDEEEIKLLERIGKVIFYKKGDLIFKENDESESFYVIKSGKVEVFLERGDSTITITHLYEGSFFGEIGFFTGSKRSASIVTEEDSELIVYNRRELLPVLENNKEMGYKFFKALSESLSKRIISSNENLETLFFINRALVDNEKFRNLFISYTRGKKEAPSSNG